MKNLAPEIVRQRLLMEGFYATQVDENRISEYLSGVARHLDLRTYGEAVIHSPGGEGREENAGFDAFIPLIDSGISLYVWSSRKFFASLLFTCKGFDIKKAVSFTQEFFAAEELAQLEF